MKNLNFLLVALLIMLNVFWVLNSSEKIYSLVKKPALELSILGPEKYYEENTDKVVKGTFIFFGKKEPKGFFRNPSRWHQVRKWYMRSIDNLDLVEKLSFYTLLMGAIFETFITTLFLITLIKWSQTGQFSHIHFQLGIISSIVLFTSLYLFDAVLDGNRLELFEHHVYIGVNVIFYLVSWAALITKAKKQLSDDTKETKVVQISKAA